MGELVELIKVSPGILVDLKYATEKNFTGKKIYSFTRCFLRGKTAEKLHKAQLELEKRGLGLKIFDGYRPLSVQKILWEQFPDPNFVADPQIGSKHNRGAAVDLTLVGLDGKELPMPTEFDVFDKRAHRSFMEIPEEVKENRKLLETVMCAHGFLPFESEWWHFDDCNWQAYSILDLPIPC